MNPILQVKLRFEKEKNKPNFGPKNLKTSAKVSCEKVNKLLKDLENVLYFYHNSPKIVDKILIDVNYNDIVAKSNRITEILKSHRKTPNDCVVGARFSDAPAGKENHIITYYVDEDTINDTINNLKVLIVFLTRRLDGCATAYNFNEPDNKINYSGFENKAKSVLRELIVDCSVIDSFSVPRVSNIINNDSFLVTFYSTELPVTDILEKIHLDRTRYPVITCGKNTISVNKEVFEMLEEKIPYMISMISSDFSKISLNSIIKPFNSTRTIPEPSNEPIVGVIDTFFNENVYFANWVDNRITDDFEGKPQKSGNENEHGTEVTSIIVDGPALNPWLDDGCGRFRVRHFGVCADRISIPRLVNKIRDIVTNNPDIHVWNLSLGNEEEISRNFISYDASFLDELQSNNNVIFVIAGTNDNRNERTGRIKIGTPADSLNSVVVNSVKRNGLPASYSRKGNILSFFNKPDVSYYGGDYEESERITAYSSNGEEAVYGTSFAAPWVSRKLCYLIEVMGLQREVAKALIIDAAAGWEYKKSTYLNKELLGYGILPVKIDQILTSASEEIKFVIYGTSESYRTANYGIPVPMDENDKYPYVARAVLCYFPECSRDQGVDYTLRELSLKFGRIDAQNKIMDINENNQDDEKSFVDERSSRKEFRKWENTKFISKVLKSKLLPVKSYNKFWGISVTSKERLASKTQKPLNFGIVITLKEVNDINRIQDFIRACTVRGWIVNKLDIQNQINIYNTNQEDIVFD